MEAAEYQRLAALGIFAHDLTLQGGPITLEPPLYVSGVLQRDCQIGRYSAVHQWSNIGPQTTVGRYSQVSNRCQIGAGAHPTDWLSTHFFQYRADFMPYPADHPFGLLNGFEETRPTRIGTIAGSAPTP